MKMLKVIALMSCAWAGIVFGAGSGRRFNPIKVYVKNESKADVQVGLVDSAGFKRDMQTISAKDLTVHEIGTIDMRTNLIYIYTGVGSKNYEYQVNAGKIVDSLGVTSTPPAVLVTISYTGVGPAWKFTETITPYNG
jgi:hypothetical protein